MGKLHKKVVRVLKQSFPDMVDALEELPETKGVSGVVISAAFNGLTHKTRQSKLSRVLKAGLTREEEAIVGPIATLTPAEATIETI